MTIPVIDLFAGPGGLGEGFASLRDSGKRSVFRIHMSIEKEESAYRTLLLRTVFRTIRSTPAARHYYSYVRGKLTSDEFHAIPAVAAALDAARREVRCHELGRTDSRLLDAQIKATLHGQTRWVLIGGPPCQAYSLAGRARRANDRSFKRDERHFLYQEYLRIIRVHRPTVFVMENVKGLLSSRHSGQGMFNRIVDDLSGPGENLEYEIRSFVKHPDSGTLTPDDYVIECERFGIPQSRHRVVLLGVRKDFNLGAHRILKPADAVTVHEAIGDLPRIRSRLSRGEDSVRAWTAALRKTSALVEGWAHGDQAKFATALNAAVSLARSNRNCGAPFLELYAPVKPQLTEFLRWVTSSRLAGTCQHEARAHMERDLARYLFAAVFAKLYGGSPKLPAFPRRLLPAHTSAKRWSGTRIPFPDRFRVQCADKPASTVVSHIAKDGHYYIHPDPAQCRSLTVREAARLQTFPDDYFFEGTRTQQYIQIGNAVPPLLARKLAASVAVLMEQADNQLTTSVCSAARRPMRLAAAA